VYYLHFEYRVCKNLKKSSGAKGLKSGTGVRKKMEGKITVVRYGSRRSRDFVDSNNYKLNETIIH
jgi:hypothetical protein